MPPVAPRHPLTGLRRRGTKRRNTSNSRWMHLSHKEVGHRAKLQRAWLFSLFDEHTASHEMQQLLITWIILQQSFVDPARTNPTISFIFSVLTLLKGQELEEQAAKILLWFNIDHILYDIAPWEEAYSLTYMPRVEHHISEWSDQVCDYLTSFINVDLRKIYLHFDLARFAGEDGYVRVATGHTNQRGTPCFYRFHPEELFLFFMTRCKKGFSIKDMCNQIFGGNYSRWSYGFRAILFYIDARYRSILGHEGLLRFRHRFPEYHNAIERRVCRPKIRTRDDGTRYRSPGLAFLPFRMFSFIDCSATDTNTPFSGPEGDYNGAPRRPQYRIAQRSVYTRFKSMHGVKTQTVMTPDGIHTVFGPVSARRSDTGLETGNGLLAMSRLNEFLVTIQQGRPDTTPTFCSLGDCAYGVNLQCIRSYYRAYYNPAMLTAYMRECDLELRGCRQHIELKYGRTASLFSICNDPSNFKLAQHTPYAVELLRACYLLCNIYTCLKGCSASGYNTFDCSPPSLEDYLRLN